MRGEIEDTGVLKCFSVFAIDAAILIEQDETIGVVLGVVLVMCKVNNFKLLNGVLEGFEREVFIAFEFKKRLCRECFEINFFDIAEVGGHGNIHGFRIKAGAGWGIGQGHGDLRGSPGGQDKVFPLSERIGLV